jgi:probable F420-dependent oxidoreductase
MDLGPIGVIHNLDFLTGGEATRLARTTEELGYGALWLGEVVIGRDPFALAAHLLSNTKKLIVGTTAANVWKRDPLGMIGAARTLAELYPDRFVLGVGVSHEFLLTRYKVPHQKPLSFMRQYLAAMKSARYLGPAPTNEPPIMLGALFPKMTALANEQTQGVFPNLATPEHTARVRSLMAPEKWLCVTQTLTLETDPAKARAAGRMLLNDYIRFTNYARNLRSLGFDDSDFENGFSDRLVDAVVVWGDAARIKERIAAHHAAGATHVGIQALRTDGDPGPDYRALEALAPR